MYEQTDLFYPEPAWEPRTLYIGVGPPRPELAELPQVSGTGVRRVPDSRLWHSAGHTFGTNKGGLLCQKCGMIDWEQHQAFPIPCPKPDVTRNQYRRSGA